MEQILFTHTMEIWPRVKSLKPGRYAVFGEPKVLAFLKDNCIAYSKAYAKHYNDTDSPHVMVCSNNYREDQTIVSGSYMLMIRPHPRIEFEPEIPIKTRVEEVVKRITLTGDPEVFECTPAQRQTIRNYCQNGKVRVHNDVRGVLIVLKEERAEASLSYIVRSALQRMAAGEQVITETCSKVRATYLRQIVSDWSRRMGLNVQCTPLEGGFRLAIKGLQFHKDVGQLASKLLIKGHSIDDIVQALQMLKDDPEAFGVNPLYLTIKSKKEEFERQQLEESQQVDEEPDVLNDWAALRRELDREPDNNEII